MGFEDNYAAARKAADFFELNLNLFKTSADREKVIQTLENDPEQTGEKVIRIPGVKKNRFKSLDKLFEGKLGPASEEVSFFVSDTTLEILSKNNISIADCAVFCELKGSNRELTEEFLNECEKQLLPYYLIEIPKKGKQYIVVSLFDKEKIDKIEKELSANITRKVLLDAETIRKISEKTKDALCSVNIPQNEQKTLYEVLRGKEVCVAFVPVGDDTVTAVMLNSDREKIAEAMIDFAVEKSLTKHQDSVDRAMQKRYVLDECQEKGKDGNTYYIVFPYSDDFIEVTKNGYEVKNGFGEVTGGFSGRIDSENTLRNLLYKIDQHSFPVFTEHLPDTSEKRRELAKTHSPKNSFTQSYIENLAAKIIRDAYKCNIAIINANSLTSVKTINALSEHGYNETIAAIKELSTQNQSVIFSFVNRFIENFGRSPQINRYSIQNELFEGKVNVSRTNRNVDYEKIREEHNVQKERKDAEELE